MKKILQGGLIAIIAIAAFSCGDFKKTLQLLHFLAVTSKRQTVVCFTNSIKKTAMPVKLR